MKRVAAIILLMSVPLLAKIQPSDLCGRWSKMYKGNYGYEFRLNKNSTATVILYLQNHASVFKGIYTVEREKLLITVNELKDDSIRKIDDQKKFVKASSSQFVFHASIAKKGKKKTLILKPLSITIDGTTSDGYFEPEIDLEKK